MDPISSPNPQPDSDSPPLSGAPGQVVGPGGSVIPTHAPAPHPSPSIPSAVTVSPSTAAPASPSVSAAAHELPRPTAVADSLAPDSLVVLPPQAAIFGAMPSTEPVAPAKTSFIKKFAGKRMLILAAVPILLIGGSAAAYFGYVVPNQPDNVWASALTNSGKAYDKLADYAQTQIDSTSKGVNIDASFKITGQFIADGTFKGSSYGDNSEFTGSLSTSGIKANVDLRSLKSTGDTPDIYFKVDGLQGVSDLLGGDPALSSSISSVNGSWYFVDHTLLEQYAKEAGTSSTSTFKSSDVKSVLDAVGTASKQNVFTVDPTKMAFVVKQKVGKEKIDGRNTYHFKAGVDNSNLTAYEKALCSELKDSSLKKFFNNSSPDTADAIGCKDVDTSISNIESDQTADVWVDMHTKLIHKIRFTDKTNSQNYFDVIQDFQGGDEIPFSLNVHDKEDVSLTTASLNATLNMKTNKLTMNGNLKITDNNPKDTPQSGSFSLTVSPNAKKVNVAKPDNAKNIAQLVSDLGLDGLFGGDSFGGGSSISDKSADTERKSDINALHAEAEAYEAENAYYPSLANLNDANWRKTNMAGLDSEALKDPDGSSGQIVASPTTQAYSYQATPAGCDNVKVKCLGYTLTATLSDGSTYIKQALDDPTSSSILN